MNPARDAFGEYVNSREYQQFRKSQVKSVPPSGQLDREKAREVLDRFRRGEQGVEATLAQLEGCVVPDPRLARIAALPAEVDPNGLAWLSADDVAEILGGGPA